MARRWPSSGIHLGHNIGTSWRFDRCQLAGDMNFGGFEACERVLNLIGDFRSIAESSELFSFGKDFSAGHGVDDKGDDDADPGDGVRMVIGGEIGGAYHAGA